MQISLEPSDLRPLIQEIVAEAVKHLPAATPAPAEPLLLTIGQAAQTLSLSESTIYKATAAGEISAVRIGAAVRYRPETLRQWARTQERGTE